MKTINRGGQIQGQKRVDFSFSKPDTSVGHDPGSCLSESAVCGDEETLSPLDNKHCPSGLAEASKKIKQHCKSFEGFEKKNPLLVVFLLLVCQIYTLVCIDLRTLWAVDCNRVWLLLPVSISKRSLALQRSERKNKMLQHCYLMQIKL